MRPLRTIALGFLLFASPATATDAPSAPDAETASALAAAVAAPHRSDANRARDAYRHPVETLTFFGLDRDMTVVELWPGGGGWYTEILAPVLKGKGKLIAAGTDPEGKRGKYAQEFHAKMQANPEIYGEVVEVVLEPPGATNLGAPGSADLVLTFRNSHGWINDGVAESVYAAAFQVLKPGGVLGVVQHRGVPDADVKTSAKTGYVPEDALVRMIEAAGFRLDARSEINANPRDTKDHPEGVWTLPPAYRLKDVDRAKYEAIGESDRMTLRFVKPVPAS